MNIITNSINKLWAEKKNSRKIRLGQRQSKISAFSYFFFFLDNEQLILNLKRKKIKLLRVYVCLCMFMLECRDGKFLEKNIINDISLY